MNNPSISAGNTYSGSHLIAYASRSPSVLLFLENSSSSIQTGDQYDVVAIEHGFLQMQGGVNKTGDVVTVRLSY